MELTPAMKNVLEIIATQPKGQLRSRKIVINVLFALADAGYVTITDDDMAVITPEGREALYEHPIQ